MAAQLITHNSEAHILVFVVFSKEIKKQSIVNINISTENISRSNIY